MAFCRITEEESEEEMGRCPVRRNILVFCYTMAALSRVYYLPLLKQQLSSTTTQPSLKQHVFTVLVFDLKKSTKQDS